MMTNHSHLLGLLYASIGLLVLVILFMSSEEGSKVATIYFWQNPSYRIEETHASKRSSDSNYQLRSIRGVLSTTFDIQYGTRQLGDFNVLNADWGKSMGTGPTLRVNPGDLMKITVVNLLANETTNLHFHGMSVSPIEDDSLRPIESQQNFTYIVRVPSNHPAGTFWYHSHATNSEKQVTRGIAGIIIVEGLLNPFPALSHIAEQHITLRALPQPNATGPENGTSNASLRLLNNQISPTLLIQPREMQLWRVVNMAADVMFNFKIEPPLPLYEIARDGHLLVKLKRYTDAYLISPGSRVEFLVVGPPEGRYLIISQSVSNGQGPSYTTFIVGYLNSTGEPFPSPPSLPKPEDFPKLRDLTKETITRYRTIDLAMDRKKSFSGISGGPYWFINDTSFSADRVDFYAKIGDVERWRIINSDFEYHSWHTHQVPFQVVTMGGIEQPFEAHQDTVIIPYAKPPQKFEVEIIVAFTDRFLVGRFPFHCHMLQHEDNGMMGLVEVSSASSITSSQFIMPFLFTAIASFAIQQIVLTH